jgi:uncharacterized pyridoxamine 5'-phosphate oxidase family protein
MNKQEIFAFLNKYKGCILASSEAGQPHARGMMIFRADENGIVFHTGSFKDVHKQLMANPKVELCFNNGNPNFMEYVQVRVTGVAAPDNDPRLKQEIIAERAFLKPVIAKYGEDGISVFRVRNLVATVWTMATNLAPKEYIELK